jgi:pilus assembly protein Flp/PilA
MNIQSLKTAAVSFIRDEEGAQVVEYALIIAVVSIALVIALRLLTTSFGTASTGFIKRVADCLTGTTATSCV